MKFVFKINNTVTSEVSEINGPDTARELTLWVTDPFYGGPFMISLPVSNEAQLGEKDLSGKTVKITIE